MFGAFTSFGKLGSLARAIAAAWTPSALWPTGTEPGMWIDPSNLASQWQDSTGTTPVATPGTVADSSNPVGLALDLRLGATVLTDPGNHLLQATSTARPLLSARVNLLTYTEDFSNVAWQKIGSQTISTNATTAPDGTLTADKLKPSAASDLQAIYQSFTFISANYSASVYAKAGEYNFLFIRIDGVSNGYVWFDLLTGTVGTTTSGKTASISSAGNGWFKCTVRWTSLGGSGNVLIGASSANNENEWAGSGTGGIYLWGAQLSSTSETYQRVGAASDYTATGFPQYLKFDGVDDALSSATFAAGTLTSSMDCLIAVRRDSAANAVFGLYNAVADATKYFGMAESGSGSGCVGSGAGTPTVWVDGAQLTGGTAVTRGTLHTALTVGDWHILELRGLDLSTWTAAGAGLYTSYVLNGAQGGILLFPSSTSTADRDAARTWLGAKVGLTL